MRLIVQPGSGLKPVIQAVSCAKKSVDILIFRFDDVALQRALIDAAGRGVLVRALIAFTNRGGEGRLRKLEQRFLASGITVARTADDLVRYHGKMLIVDDRQLFMLGFNFTHLDVERSRSFGVISTNRRLVQEARRLFECDVKRQPFKCDAADLVVSPVNARRRLAEFITHAKRQLLIYDPKVSDASMVKIVEERQSAGVDVRVIGRVTKSRVLKGHSIDGMRLHTRTIVRDGRDVFLGSQSLRKLELERRREVGVIFRDQKIARRIIEIFEADWKKAVSAVEQRRQAKRVPAKAVKKVAKRVSRTVAKHVPAKTVARELLKAVKAHVDVDVDHRDVEEAVQSAVEDAVKTAVAGATKRVAKTLVQAKAS